MPNPTSRVQNPDISPGGLGGQWPRPPHRVQNPNCTLGGRPMAQHPTRRVQNPNFDPGGRPMAQPCPQGAQPHPQGAIWVGPAGCHWPTKCGTLAKNALAKCTATHGGSQPRLWAEIFSDLENQGETPLTCLSRGAWGSHGCFKKWEGNSTMAPNIELCASCQPPGPLVRAWVGLHGSA